MKKKLPILLIFFVILGFFSVGNAAPKGVIRAAVASFLYESTDPNFWSTFWGRSYYDILIGQDENGNYNGVVAESWTISADGLDWTFKIREGIKFHNGDPLTAEDVAWSIERFASEESTNAWSPYLRKNFKSVEATDKYTVVYHCQKPEPMLITPFSETYILPKKYFESLGQDEFRKKPIGSGPWKWSKLVPKTRMELKANTEYWGEIPKYAKYIEYMVPEESTRVAMLKRGDVDIAFGLSTDRVIEMDKAGYKLQEIGPPIVENFSIQGSWFDEAGPVHYKQFRKAMSYAIDRQELCETFYRGLCKAGGRWFMFEKSWGWGGWDPEPYAPEKVKQLLKEINYPDAFSNPVVQIYTQAQFADAVQALVGYWDAAGIQTKIHILDPGGFAKYFFVRLKDKTAGNVGAVIPWLTYSAVLNQVYHSANMFKSTGAHSTGNDPVADKMYEDVTSTMDLELAKKKWIAFMEYTHEMYVNIPTVQRPAYIVVGPKLGKFKKNTHQTLYQALTYIDHP